MNALCYKIVFSKRLGALVAVGEHTSGQGKAAGTGVRTAVYPSSTVGATGGEFVGSLKAVFASVALTCFTATTIAAGPAANTLPTGYSVNSGNVAVSTSGADMTIKQTTDKASVNWQSFSIGSAASVNIQQNSASSVLLNRVVGNDPSQIFGKLTANGQVILINPNGIVFGKGGSVTASAFTASTFGMTEDDFNKGKRKFSRNGSTASVTVEEGASINTTTPGGYIALIASTVNNQGSISAKQGSVVLAAAETVTLPSALTDNVGIPLSSKVRLELAPSTIKASVENGGTITTEGGQVLMQAAAVADAVARITHTGTIDTTGVQGGTVDILADHGQIRVSGSIKANSTKGTAGGSIIIGRDDKIDPETGKLTTVLAAATDVSGAKLESKGGFVETSGDWLATYGTKVKAKDWLLDPYNISIVSSGLTGQGGYNNTTPGMAGPDISYTPGATSTILNTDIQNSLNDGTNVKISTGLSGSLGGDVGNIYVGANITKTTGGDARLTLEANNAITFGAYKITGTGSGKLDVNLIAKGGKESASSAGVYVVGGGGIDTNGKVVVDATTKYTGGWDFTKSALAMRSGSIISGSDVDIKLNVDFNKSPTTYQVYGAFLQNEVTLQANAGNLSIDSKISEDSKSNLSNAILIGSNYGNASVLKATGGNVSLTADWSGNSGGGGGISIVDTTVSATGNILVDSKVSNNGMNAIRTGNGGSGKGFSAISTGNGNVTFIANKGAIGLGNLTSKIKGKDVTINNGTGASGLNTGVAISGQGIDATGKIYIKGTALGSGAGVNAVGTYTTTGTSPSDTLYVEGTSATGNGVRIGTIGSPTALSTGAPVPDKAAVTIIGTSLGGTGSGIAQTGAITAKDMTIRGNAFGGSGVTGLGVLTARGDVHIEGASATSNGIYLNDIINNNSTTGGITNVQASTGNIQLSRAAVINSGPNAGAININAGNGTATSTAAIISEAGATINQQSNGGVTMSTDGVGNLTVTKIVNTGSGTVILAAGKKLDAGNGGDGQVKTIAGNTITNNTSQTQIYSGSAANTDDLTSLMAGNNLGKLATLYLTNAGAITQNAQVNTAFGNKASDTAPAQVMFRENIQFDAKLNPTSLTKNFGDADPTTDAFKAALKAVNTSTETALTSITNTGNKQFKVGTSEFIDTLTGNLPGTAGTTRGPGTYKYTGTSSKTNIGVSSADVARSIAQLTVNSANITPVPAPVTPSTNPARVKVPVGSANPFALASAEDLADETCSANSVENCHCEESAVSQGVDICYEPKTAAKGSVR